MANSRMQWHLGFFVAVTAIASCSSSTSQQSAEPDGAVAGQQDAGSGGAGVGGTGGVGATSQDAGSPVNACLAGAPGKNDNDGSAAGAGGSLICPTDKTACNGVCVDTQTENGNCGGCGVVCSAVCPSTARCTAGRCLTTLVVSDWIGSLTVDSSSVYVLADEIRPFGKVSDLRRVLG